MKIDSPNPGPEVEKLGYFVGNWFTEGTIFAGPWGAGGTFSWTEKTEWMAGNFFVIGRWDFNMPDHLGGHGEEIFIMGYDPNEKAYTFDAFTSQGRHQVSRGTVSGSAWVWTSQGTYGSDTVRQKYMIEVVSETNYKLRFEICEDGTHWLPFMEATALKEG